MISLKRKEDIIVIKTRRKTKEKVKKMRLWWWDFNPENDSYFLEKEEII